MNNPQADAIFRQRYGTTPNVMTPHIWARRMIAKGTLAVELSSGDSIEHPHTRNHDTLWGVTVILVHDISRRHDLSEVFRTRAAAEAYIERLRHIVLSKLA